MKQMPKYLAIFLWLLGSFVGASRCTCYSKNAQIFGENDSASVKVVRDLNGDGDLSGEIQQAIEQLGTKGGKIYLPDGNWTIGVNIIKVAPATDNLEIIGSGLRRTLLHLLPPTDKNALSNQFTAIQLGDSSAVNTSSGQIRYVTLRGFSILYDRTNTPVGGNAIGIKCWTVRRSLFEDIWIENFGIGILCKNVCDFNIFRGVYTRNCSTCALWLVSQANGNRIESCDFLQVVSKDLARAQIHGSGIRFDYYCLQNVIQNCRFHNFSGSTYDEAVHVSDASTTCAIRDNYFENCDIGIRLTGGQQGWLSGILIEGNYFFAMRKSAIILSDPAAKFGIRGITISTNTIENTRAGTEARDGEGIRIEDNCSDVELINNVFLSFQHPESKRILNGKNISGIQISGSTVEPLNAGN
jgi:hypothetical protein